MVSLGPGSAPRLRGASGRDDRLHLLFPRIYSGAYRLLQACL